MKQGALATGFYLIAYDELTGRSGLAPDLLACGLVGAQLGDLVAAGALSVDEEDRVVANRAGRPAPADGTAMLVLDSIAHETRPHPVRAWTDALGEPLLSAVRNELLRRGVLTQETARSLLGRRRHRLTVADRAAAHEPGIALREMVRRPGTFTLHGAFSLALISALGVERLLEPEVDRTTARDLARDAVTHLPASLVRLHSGIAEAAASASLTVRR
ncbi:MULTISPECIES: GOLPH3/VPS74 family protein [Pseudonocardia]|uniref:Golgi phosphoprotein 3 (GPP34) n=2 Tax=Pseudonocardia TaxID=1847 RepID=A0A1Y2MT61_PSEAH|nr:MULTISPECIES: GPP34 family phosphoprotein [Pseudonocardia]OSY38392.1 hypothetical protein BG845_04153 [Pseudonocardia autotrophica]TDN72564.1 Golgi phosphoprotein 3 GPP34 [Pseudonocardia autotrophica]BBG03272.1 hypothetical protein Pdca_44810 [Pseudonocardia autotrophica]GEC24530.1 hypothetical protein PSA01_15590 [Pseudonocardia saturnea]